MVKTCNFTRKFKGEFAQIASQYLHAYQCRLPEVERERWQKLIKVIDFANTELIAPYNFVLKQPFVSDELTVANRIDTISEQFSGLSELSV